MERKRWVLIFSALCLALALTSSPVAAQQTICDKGNFCDRDEDGLFRVHNKCMICEGSPDCDDNDRFNACLVEEDTTPGSKSSALRMTFDDMAGDNIRSDDGSTLVDKKGAGVSAGERSQPIPAAGIHLGLNATKNRHGRQLRLDITCVGIDFDGDGDVDINNCDQLPALGGNFFGLKLFPTCEENNSCDLGAMVRPYKVNCPEILPNTNNECPDVFTMLEATTTPLSSFPVLMNFRLSFSGGNLLIEVASAIGGDGGLDPGRCLSLLETVQRDLFMSQCAADGKCNVSVEAFDDGSFTGAGVNDGENDEWVVQAIGVTALICDRGTSTVLGKATLTFGFNAIKKK